MWGKLSVACVFVLIIFAIVFYLLRKKNSDKTNILRDILLATASGIISGLVVLLFSMPIGTDYNNKLQEELIDENLIKIRLGISKDYCDQIFGAPIISNNLKDDYYKVDLNEDGQFENYSYNASGYKLKKCVLLCVYRDNTLDAFVIISNMQKYYKVKPVSNKYLSGTDRYLLDFSYAEFCKDVQWDLISSYSSNEKAFYHYFEMTGGGHIDNYIYYLIGNYDVTYGHSESLDNLYELVDYGDRCTVAIDTNESSQADELKRKIILLRNSCKPNVYGEVNYTIYNQFDFTKDIVSDVVSYNLLFERE